MRIGLTIRIDSGSMLGWKTMQIREGLWDVFGTERTASE